MMSCRQCRRYSSGDRTSRFVCLCRQPPSLPSFLANRAVFLVVSSRVQQSVDLSGRLKVHLRVHRYVYK